MLYPDSYQHTPGAEIGAISANIWLSLKEQLRKKMPSQVFFVFFSDITAELTGNELVLNCPSVEVERHLQRQYVRQIADEAKQLGFHGEIVLRTATTQAAVTPAKAAPATKNQRSETAYPNRIDLNPNYTFDRFIKGPSNEHAYAAALGAAQKPNDYHNPLYIYGGEIGRAHV
mgnify:FL=1